MKAKGAVSDRRWSRFKPDPSSPALIDIQNRKGKFQPSHNALLVNESFKGCCIVMSSDKVENGDVVRVRIADLEPMEAEVRWVHHLDVDLLKVGLFFLD